MRTRSRAKGRIGSEGERFARIPVSVLESEAATTLGHAAFRILVILASQCWGRNNGILALTEHFARRYGFTGRDTLYRSLRDLEERGLIVCTRRGIKQKNVFSLYALGWVDIHYRDGRELDTPQPCNRSAWLKWTGPSRRRRRRSKTEIHTDDRESSTPIVGNGAGKSVPKNATTKPASIPLVGNTLRVSAHSASERASNASASAVCDLRSKVRVLLLELPDLSDSEVARMLSMNAEQVRDIRESEGVQKSTFEASARGS